LVEARRLCKRFGGVEAVREVDLNLHRGEVLGFLGPNGAGKTTTMRMLSGYLRPDAGSVCVSGVDIAKQPLEARRHIGYLPEGAPAYMEMRVEDFLAFVARARGFAGRDVGKRVASAMEKVHLGSYAGQRIETLSKGYRRRTGIAQALLHDPPVLILDEPTDGLDPNQKFEVRQLVRSLGQDRAVLLSTHILEEVEAVCTRAVVLHRGATVFDGTPRELDALAPQAMTHGRLDHVFRTLTGTRAHAPSPVRRRP
jgi:ABC-2 type transport system ATP-binding protein